MSKRARVATEATPISEVGLPTANDNSYHALIEQNKNLLALIEQLTQNKSNNDNVTLPKFNAEGSNADVASWCATVDLIMSERKIDGSALIIALSKCMRGSASEWLSQISYPGMKWEDFKPLLIQRYGALEGAAATIANLLESKPEEDECISVYSSRMVTTLMAKLKNCNTEEIAVSIVLAHATRISKGLQRLLFTKEIKTRNVLQQELKAHAYENKTSQTSSLDHSKSKIVKGASNVTCHFCGKIGHKMIDCRIKQRSLQKPNQHVETKQKTAPTCYKCGVVGHISSVCPAPPIKKPFAEKTVNLCEAVIPRGVLFESGESFHFYLDTGAECSLAKESVAKKFSGNIFNNLIALKGIGNGLVFSNTQILTTIIINNCSLEILFHVVQDENLKYDIIIGQDILQKGIGVSIAFKSLFLYRIEAINSCVTQSICDLQNIDTDLTAGDKQKLIALLKKYDNWITTGFPKRRVEGGQFELRLKDPNKTVQRRPYRLSIEERHIVRNRIEELLNAGIIRNSCSPFASPILLIEKKDGDQRLCVDYRELNANTVDDKYPLPLISDQIARLRGSSFFSCLDMASGFYQIPVQAESIEKTAFVTPDGQYEFVAMPFGLKNAPSCFQRTIASALGELVYSYVLIYMDDVMVVASNKDEAFERLEIVLDKLHKAGFSLNFKKCSLLKTKVNYLGYEVQAGEVRPNSRKIVALTTLPPPDSVTSLRQFIGLASYFRQFVQNFSIIMKPLYFLTTEKIFKWKAEHEIVRQKIITLLTSEPVLMIFDPQYPVELHTDASSDGYGAILMQKVNNRLHVIEYYSKTTNSAESRYHSYELETMAVFNAVKHFRHYLIGLHFLVVTDCNAIKGALTKKELTPRVHRWWAYLQSFDFEVQYREGKRMAHADFLSRNCVQNSSQVSSKIEQKKIYLAEVSNDWLLAEQQKDAEISSIVNKIQNNELSESLAGTYELRGGTLYRKIQRKNKSKCLPVVPRTLRWSVINHVHESVMHLGWEKTLDKLYQFYWFEHMAKYVRKFVDNCMTCRLSKPASGKIAAELHPIPKVNIPWHTIHVDITGKLSGKNDLKEYVIVQIDAFTKYVFLTHTMHLDAESSIKALKNSISVFGLPTKVIADQGRCFTSKHFREFCASQNIDLHLIATGASRANGQVERVMSTLKSLLTAVEASNRSWQEALGEVQLAINCTMNRTTKASPIELLIGKEARPFGLLVVDSVEQEVDRTQLRSEASKNMEKAAIYEKNRFDKGKAKVVRYEVGDYVLLKNEERHQTKLCPKFRGPFKVAEVLEGDRYVLKQIHGNRTYKYVHEDLRKLPEGQMIVENEIVNEKSLPGEHKKNEIINVNKKSLPDEQKKNEINVNKESLPDEQKKNEINVNKKSLPDEQMEVEDEIE